MKRLISLLIFGLITISIPFVSAASNPDETISQVIEAEEGSSLGSRVTVSYQRPAPLPEEYVKIEGEVLRTEASSRVEENKIIIDQREVDILARKYELNMEKKSKEDAIQFFAKQTLLYHEAELKGLAATEDEIQALIQEYKDMQFVEVSAQAFDEYCAQLGMTQDEYWDSQYESFKHEITYGKYFKNLQTELFGNDAELTPEEWTSMVEDHYEKLKANYEIVFES